MDDPIYPVSKTDTLTFECHRRVPCFNECCRDLNQYLTPYDILRAKSHLGLGSGDFLEKYTRSHTGQESGLPVVTLKTTAAEGFQCPFVGTDGCMIYENRPASCRLYPLARALSRNRETGRLTEQYFLIKEAHCKGFSAGPTWTVQSWLDNQNVHPYNEMNDRIMEIISLKNRLKPGPLDFKSAQLFHLACYDLDAFRSHIFDKNILGDDTPDQKTLECIEKDDTALLRFGMDWIQKILF